MLPPEYTARCVDCTWRTTTTAIAGNPDPREYRDLLADQHQARYGHTTERNDYP